MNNRTSQKAKPAVYQSVTHPARGEYAKALKAYDSWAAENPKPADPVAQQDWNKKRNSLKGSISYYKGRQGVADREKEATSNMTHVGVNPVSAAPVSVTPTHASAGYTVNVSKSGMTIGVGSLDKLEQVVQMMKRNNIF